ncbi:MAG TPA: hypothetical protein VMH05_12845 [Bryobacteraceae bacterium]|nr:hypothetical protein [Bryobacteraceae bacterium]
MNRRLPVPLLTTVFLLTTPALAQPTAESSNMTLVGHNDLNGNGDGGEGLALQQWPDGRRILYLAHEGQKSCLSIVDVTHPEQPVLINQLPSPAPGVTRCNSLGLAGNVLAVANQTLRKGEKSAGMWVLDVSDFARLQKAKTLGDLALSFFDTSGANSRGVHCLWFVDGEFAHLTTGMPDFDPTNPNDDQFYLVVDLRDPRHPREVGRWWYPGTRKGDACLPECLPARNPKFDSGYRPHQVEVWPDHPDRAYMAYIEGGAFILDISGLAEVKAGRARSFTPKIVGQAKFGPPYTGFTHTFQPLFNRGLALVSDEATADNCKDAPKLVWLMDIRAESNPMVIGTAPWHANDGELCRRGGRFGAHNIHPNFPGPLYAQLKNTTVASWFNGGVRIFHIASGPAGVPDAPPHLEEIGYYIPAAPPRNPSGTSQMNHAIVDEHGLIYTNDRFTGGLYILRYTGSVPLD